MGIWHRIAEAFGRGGHRSAADPTDEDISPRQLGYEDLERDKVRKEDQTTGVGYVAGDRTMNAPDRETSGLISPGSSDFGVPRDSASSPYEAMSQGMASRYDQSESEMAAHATEQNAGPDGSSDGGVALGERRVPPDYER
jgi:hypothetical protein